MFTFILPVLRYISFPLFEKKNLTTSAEFNVAISKDLNRVMILSLFSLTITSSLPHTHIHLIKNTMIFCQFINNLVMYFLYGLLCNWSVWFMRLSGILGLTCPRNCTKANYLLNYKCLYLHNIVSGQVIYQLTMQ